MVLANAGAEPMRTCPSVMSVGSVIGAYAGARFFMRIPAVWLARAFVVLAVVSAARLALT